MLHSGLANFFTRLAKGELEVEDNRIKLCSVAQFHPWQIYRELDFYSLNNLMLMDFRRWVKATGVYAKDIDIDMFIQQYDNNHDSRLNFDEFQAFVLTTTRHSLTCHCLNQPSFTPACKAAKYAFTRLLDSELRLHRDLEAIRQELASKGVELWAVYKVIKRGHHAVSRQALQTFMHNSGCYILETELDAVLRRLDDDGDQALNFPEFSAALTPRIPIKPLELSFQSISLKSRSLVLSASSSPAKSPQVQRLRRSPALSALCTPEKSKLESRRPLSHQKVLFREPVIDTTVVKKCYRKLAKGVHKAAQVIEEVTALQDFDCGSFFQLLDFKSAGIVSLIELEQAASALGVQFSPEACLLIMRRLSLNCDCYLRYSDLLAWLYPSKLPELRLPKPMTQATHRAIAELLTALFETEVLAEEARRELDEQPDMNFFAVFKYTDRNNDGFLTTTDFAGVLKDLALAKALMAFFDRGKRGGVNYTKFVQELVPKTE
jgi:Ca2+-binding EF-hand superfamily protein